MKYKELNDTNKLFMKEELNTDLKFEWEDESLMDVILGRFKTIYPYQGDPEEFVNNRTYLSRINRYIDDYNKRKISSEKFITCMRRNLSNIIKKFPELKYRENLNIDFYKEEISKSKRLLIDGEAGIGKSYFIYKVEEELEKIKISHLCFYCKYTKNITNEILNELLNEEDLFYFVVDAFNELSEEEQKNLLDLLLKIKIKKNIHIIVSYRTNNIEVSNKNKLMNLLKNEYTFKGVSYESSLIKIVETYGIETSKFIDILETNNPFYIKMLYEILTDKKIKKNKIGDLVQITFILESYIKNKSGNEFWENTKQIGKLMYEQEKHYITEDEINNILNEDSKVYLDKMIKNNLIDFYIYENEKRYIFKLQTLFDYLIARTLQNEIDDLTDEEIINLINKKSEKMYSISEALIILLIDRYKTKDLIKAFKLIFNSKLKSNFELEIFRKMVFTREQSNQIQKLFKNIDCYNAFNKLGGYHSRPYNCTEYINDFFIKSKKIVQIVPKYTYSSYLTKLKNALYNVLLISTDNEYIEETFWYAFWLCSTPNERVRLLANKVLFEIAKKYEGYSLKLINVYKKIKDYYIKKSIIYIITSLPVLSSIEIAFLKKILYSTTEISAEIIYRISNRLNKNYISLTKKNEYAIIEDNIDIDKNLDLNRIIFISDIYEKYLLKFERYNKENELSFFDNFILNNKRIITKWNKELKKNFCCVENDGYCKYSGYDKEFQNRMEKIDIIPIDNKKMFILFQEIFKDVCKKYNYHYNKDERFDDHLNLFSDSMLKKCLLIAQDLMLGSLMCNYYINNFSIYGDNKTFGYALYEPFNFAEQEFNILSPVSLYSESIDRLNNKIIKKLNLYDERDYNWFINSELSLDNIKKALEPIIYRKEEWSLIGADIHMYVSDEYHTNVFIETYDISISVNSKKKLVGDRNSRDLTIDREECIGCPENYINSNYFTNTIIKSINYNSKDFKNTYLSFPPTDIIKILNLKYDAKYSTWINGKGEVIIYCDNNSKEYYHDFVTRSIYIKTNALNELKEKCDIKYWAYTEKNYMDEGWNEDACLHVELDKNAHIVSKFKNNSLTNDETEVNIKCKKCKFGIYQELNKPFDYSKFKDILSISAYLDDKKVNIK